MALVVLLRGVNVGDHRAFRPTTLTKQLNHLDAVNIGAAGTIVIRQPITRAQLTTRNWNTVIAVARVQGKGGA